MTSRGNPVNRLVGQHYSIGLVHLIVLALLLAPGPKAHAGLCPNTPRASIETSIDAHGGILVPVTLNGTSTLATLDTGAPISVLRESMAEELGLSRTPIPLNAMTGVSGRPFEESAVVKAVGLGGIVVDGATFLIAPRTHASDSASAGLIGADVFSRFDLMLDLGGDQIAFYTPGTCLPPDSAAITAAIVPSRHVYLRLEIDGQRVMALLDTGASRSVMTFDTLHRLFGLDANSAGVLRIGRMEGADGGAVDAYAHGFKSLVMGDIVLAQPEIILVPDETRRLHRVLTPGQQEGEGLPDLVLGLPELRRLQFLIAYSAGRVYVTAADPRMSR